MARAMMAFSEKLNVASDRLKRSRKYGDRLVLTMTTASSSPTRTASHDSMAASSRRGARSATS